MIKENEYYTLRQLQRMNLVNVPYSALYNLCTKEESGRRVLKKEGIFIPAKNTAHPLSVNMIISVKGSDYLEFVKNHKEILRKKKLEKEMEKRKK